MSKPRRKLSLKKRLTFSVVLLGVLFGVPEGFFRIREVVRKNRKPRLPLEFDAYRGVILTPGASYERTDQGRRVDVNSQGFRGPEIGPKGATPRLLTVGGSTTFGLYTSTNANTWPLRLQAQLTEAGHPCEVINAGTPGWTLRSSLTNLELRGWALEPDVVVVYHNYNDLMSNGEAQYLRDAEVDDVEELYRPPPGGFLDHFAVFRFARSQLRDPYDKLREKQVELKPEGVAAFEKNLRRLARRAREQGARLALCTFPHAFRPTYEQSVADEVPEIEEWYLQKGPLEYSVLLEGLKQHDAVIRRVAKDEGALLIDLSPDFPTDVSYYMSPIHHSDAGEALVATRVREALIKAGWIPAAK
ncbi:MAG: hypothetical protein KDD82_31095 [Planctomycetes bacterium]|nr:hypothetical protein [Planctomycetota bacterium]